MNKFQKIIYQLYSDNAWGTYYVHRYYFSIKTKRMRKEAGLTEIKTELTQSEQIDLQR
jgi:hypothetical protein